MTKSLFVISDLHLGGAPASNSTPSFQMCSPEGRKRLAEFIQYVTEQKKKGHDVHLVLNGDIVDFLAEQPFEPFTGQNDVARDKLERIMDNTQEIWKNLKTFVSSGAKLTLLLGNHDIELSLPGPRQVLLECLGPGRVEFIYDNQAYTVGPVLIEHGNRYDWWNVINHDKLREFRSALSRGEKPLPFTCPAGSQLVIQTMNKIKSKFPFVDLLKPEDGALLPLLVVLDPSIEIDQPDDLAFDLATKWLVNDFDKDGIPTNRGNIAAVTGIAAREEKMGNLTRRLAYGGDHRNIGVLDRLQSFWELWSLARSQTDKNKQLVRLYEALRARADTTWNAFDVQKEDEVYLKPARAAAKKRGFKVILFGHTHLVKRISLPDGLAVYLNTGTWADLMRVPDAVLAGNKEEALVHLGEFVEDIKANRLDPWREQIATFAKIEINETSVTSADVYLFDGTDKVERVPDGRLERLSRETPSFL